MAEVLQYLAPQSADEALTLAQLAERYEGAARYLRHEVQPDEFGIHELRHNRVQVHDLGHHVLELAG